MGQVTMMVDSLGVFDNNGGGTVGVPPATVPNGAATKGVSVMDSNEMLSVAKIEEAGEIMARLTVAAGTLETVADSLLCVLDLPIWSGRGDVEDAEIGLRRFADDLRSVARVTANRCTDPNAGAQANDLAVEVEAWAADDVFELDSRSAFWLVSFGKWLRSRPDVYGERGA